VIVPTTTGCKFNKAKNAKPMCPEAPLFDDDEDGEGSKTSEGGPRKKRFSADAEAALREIFFRLDVDMDGVLDMPELGAFLRNSEGVDSKGAVCARALFHSLRFFRFLLVSFVFLRPLPFRLTSCPCPSLSCLSFFSLPSRPSFSSLNRLAADPPLR
jgi:hypothetical protein